MGRLTDGAFDGRAPHRVHPGSGFRVWFTEPLGLLTQVGEKVDTDESVARFLIAAQGELDRRRGGSQRFVYVHDWRRLASYTPGARKLMTEWGLDVRSRTDSIVVALAPQAKVVRMGVTVAIMALQVAGFSMKVVDELEPTLSALDLRAATR
ncbi:MAG: hypothetical protein KF901_27890 [Myxococcales bacterium]|nr:hypothetical protein [Myxococcales bacterium]